MDNEFHALDNWAGKGLSLAGTFIDIELADPGTGVEGQLSTIWNNGYTPFVNLGTNKTAYELASGRLDNALHAWAQAFARYSDGGRRMAFIAPLQEMNGYWIPYGGDPGNYKIAYGRIQQVFSQEGVPANSVRWVFAPNGWSKPGSPTFEEYYPGDDRVDVVALSAYNFGYCPSNLYKDWQNPDEVFGPYLPRVHSMAPSKPIFIAQTGTTLYYAYGTSQAAKDRWIKDAYTYLSQFTGVHGILYFNISGDCLFTLYKQGELESQGYREAVSQAVFEYISPSKIRSLPFLVK